MSFSKNASFVVRFNKIIFSTLIATSISLIELEIVFTNIITVVLDQVFPAYKGVFGVMYSSISLRFLSEYPTSYSVLQTDEETFHAKMKDLLSTRRGRSKDWISERVKQLLVAATQNPFEQTMYASLLINLRVLITLILQYQEHLAELEQNIDALAEEIEAFALIQSIPGIGYKIAATILSEIGEINRFDHPKKLVALAGIDPSVFASGKFTATNNRMTKRGSKKLRHAFYLAVLYGQGSQAAKDFVSFTIRNMNQESLIALL
jgi:hypothetical protein